MTAASQPRPPRRPKLASLLVSFVAVAMGLSAVAQAVEPTSCDIKTGPSCAWKEGCDCDHDGYVIGSGKASKYCHFPKCPIDSDDKDPKKLGIVSAENADGDGWTKAYDCNDTDKCIGKTCGVSTCGSAPVDPDADQDGFAASLDCNDKDPNIKPGSPVACCNCANLNDPDKVKALGCSGCPLSLSPPDAGSTDAGSADAGSTGPDSLQFDAAADPGDGSGDSAGPDVATADLASPEPGKADAGKPDTAAPAPGAADSAAASPGPLTDAGSAFDPQGGLLVGSRSDERLPPPPPGCSAGAQGQAHSAWLAALWLIALVAWRAMQRSQRRSVAATAAVLAAAAVSAGACVRVEPWQRQKLAHRCMVLGRNAGEKDLEQHAFQYREGSAGGFGGGGGGCGCN